ncbi:hypothetical protein L1049_026524 [Liquidambar formosana]|uniref:Uncharacterized protein n=1 Tax=Liquidambar formosana TaxID=63359 RepID=A0AAP0NF44_LIQFO
MAAMAFAGDIILLQNVRITKFGGVVEARTVQCSSLQCLVHPYESLVLKGADDLIIDCRVGITPKEKLRKVIEWVQRAGSTLHNIELHTCQKRQLSRNWKVQEERKSRDCLSLVEVSHLTNSCKATFYASVGEIFLPFTWRTLGESEKERMFISRRLEDNNVAEDLICTGCQICGSPLNLEHRSTLKQDNVPLYCQKSSNRLHVVSLIYRPFVLYVWDETEYVPLFVTNKAAEFLFGNIRAERVQVCYRGQKHDRNVKDCDKENKKATAHATIVGEGSANSCPPDADKSLDPHQKHQCDKNPNFYLIWLILLKVLLQQGKNSPLKFEVIVNAGLDKEDGRFEMVSASMPCFRTKGSSV